jgi:hypothetical protein
MTRRLMLTTGAMFALLVFSAGAHEGHEHKILGTVSMAAADHLMVKDKAGKEFTVHITAQTKVIRDKKAAQVSDIKAEMRVVVTAVTEKVNKAERLRAKTIELATSASTK